MNQKITPWLWFDNQAEMAAEFYVSVFKDSAIISKSYYSEAGQKVHGQAPGSVMTIVFELNGQRFSALNGGPAFTFTEAISFQVMCDGQAEVDYYWEKLSEGGDEAAQQCGWLKDRFGLSWQIVPRQLEALLSNPDTEKANKAMTAMLQMKKIDLSALEQAAEA